MRGRTAATSNGSSPFPCRKRVLTKVQGYIIRPLLRWKGSCPRTQQPKQQLFSHAKAHHRPTAKSVERFFRDVVSQAQKPQRHRKSRLPIATLFRFIAHK
ncbi:MAG: hypothetical protein IKN91_00305 [Paludibacteraceae bacterium]|nr:hypothetical protein [Paludibacteraceae bacterium]